MAEQGIRVGVTGDDVIIAPPLTASTDDFERFGAAFKDALSR